MDNEENPLFYDYYGFPKELYEIKWKSFGSSEIANKVVELLQKVMCSSSVHVSLTNYL